MNSILSFSLTSCHTKLKEHSRSDYLPIAGGRIDGFILFLRVSAICVIYTASSNIWTPATVSISFDDNRHTTSTSNIYIYIYIVVLFGPVKPELGVIPSGQENHSRAEHLNFLGRTQCY